MFLFRMYEIYLLCSFIRKSETKSQNESDEAKPVFVGSHEARLVNYLLDKYKTLGTVARPVHNSSEVLEVEFGMRMIQMDIIEKEQILKTSVWIRSRWVDEYLRWNPKDFGGIRDIVLPSQSVWTPDIVLVNTAETDVEERAADVMVTSWGAIVWSPQRIYKSACLIDTTDFPYDKHTCHMWFQSMSRYKWQLDLYPYTKTPWDLSTYLASFQESQEWEIIENSTRRYDKSRSVGVLLKFSKRVALKFTLTVQRRVGYTGLLLMIPCVFLGSLTLVVFCLPPERPDRHTLATSLFGSFMVLTLILVEVAPPTASSVPKLGMYYAANMTLVMVSIFLSGLVINISRRADRRQRVPKQIEFIFVKVLSRVMLCYERTNKPFDCKKAYIDISESSRNSTHNENCDDEYNMKPLVTATRDENTHTILDKMNKLEDLMRSIASNVTSHGDFSLLILKSQWMAIALVLDRLFLSIYIISLIVAFLLLFPRPAQYNIDLF